MDSNCGNLNPSSILDLKAELQKKYQSAKNSKVNQQNLHKPLKRKSENSDEKKGKRAPIVKPVQQTSEEEQALQKSRQALEAKAKLYEKIVSNNYLIDDEKNETYLVDFQRKVMYSTPELENVSKRNDKTSNFTTSTVPENIPLKNPSSSQTKSFEQTKVQSNDNTSEPFTHYQRVHHNEVRDHGTAYFAFSTDEAERKKQMEELISMRQETEKQRLNKEKIQQKRKAMLQNRLAKICERKNIDQSVLQSFASKEESDTTEPQEADVASIPLPENQPEPEVKVPKVRPWDIGKSNLQNFVPAKSNIKSQKEWVSEKREERPSEFAPPSFYK